MRSNDAASSSPPMEARRCCTSHETCYTPAAEDPKAEEAKRLKVHLTPSLHARLQHAATENGRTLNNEIVRRLERTVLAEQIANFPALAALSYHDQMDVLRMAGDILTERAAVARAQPK
jgi:hypothetical protein